MQNTEKKEDAPLASAVAIMVNTSGLEKWVSEKLQTIGQLLFIPLIVLLVGAAWDAIFGGGPSMHDQVNRYAMLSRVAVTTATH